MKLNKPIQLLAISAASICGSRFHVCLRHAHCGFCIRDLREGRRAEQLRRGERIRDQLAIGPHAPDTNFAFPSRADAIL